MANNVPDEAFARAVQQMGVVSYDQLEAAKAAQAESAAKGVLVPLAEILVQQGVMAPATRENIEKKVRAQQQGGIQQFGQFKLLKKLGEGGMGAVYLAEDTNAGRQVALKLLPKKHAGDSEFLSRFRREARAAGQLNHVNIVSAHTVGEEMGHHYLVMEYVEGEPLDKMLKREGSLPCDKALEIVMQVARGLKHAHEHGIIHRDIKPGNIILTPKGVAKILDLGLSKTISGGDEQTFHTQTGVALGTPHYLSPEQARGDKGIDGRTDIYSLGATFYHLVTGMTPFEGSTAAVIMLKHLNEQLTNPQDIVEDLPDSVAHVIIRMMAKEPNDRYRDCKELLDDLELVIDGKEPSSQAIDVGKSSVAMARVARPRKPGAAAQHGLVVRKRATVQQEPGAPREQHIGGRKPAKAADPTMMYVGIGGAVLALGIILFLMMGGKTETDKPETQISKSGENAKTESSRKETATGKPDTRTPVQDTRPVAVQPAAGNQKLDAAPDTEKRAEGALDVLLKFDGLAAGDKAGRIQRLEAFVKEQGATIAGARARKMLGDLQKEAESAAVVDDPERWKNAIDLLALVDPTKDSVSGKWDAKGGALICDNAMTARVRIPYRPPTEYDFRIQFTRLSGSDCLAQILSASGRQFAFMAGGEGNKVFGLELIAGKQCFENPTAVRRPTCLVTGRRYMLLAQVRNNGVRMYLDGVFLTGFVGEYSQMSVRDHWAVADPATLGLASWDNTVAFHAAEVLEVTGQGTFTRPDEPAAKAAMAKREGLPAPAAIVVQPQTRQPEASVGATSEAGPVLAKLLWKDFQGGVVYQDFTGPGKSGRAIYAQPTGVNSLSGAFEMPPGYDQGILVVTSLRHDRALACQIALYINGQKVFSGADATTKPFELAEQAFFLPAGSIKAGHNEIRIVNTEMTGKVQQIPWYMVHCVEVRISEAIIKAAYETVLAEVYAFLNKSDVKGAVAKLEQAKADPKLAAMKAALDRDLQCAAYMEEIDKAVAAGAALLADKRPFVLKMCDGKETAVGQGTKNAVVGVKDSAVQIEMDLGGGKASTRIPLEQLAPETRYELACLGMPPGPESEIKLAFAGLLALQTGGENIALGAIRKRLDACAKNEALAALVAHIRQRLDSAEREPPRRAVVPGQKPETPAKPAVPQPAGTAAAPSAPSKPVTLVAKASEALTKSGFSVEKDKFYKIITEGTWTGGDGKAAGLLGQIGETKILFDVTGGITFQAPENGELIFKMNDDRLGSPKRQGAIQIKVGELPGFKWPAANKIHISINLANILGMRANDLIFTKEGIKLAQGVGAGWRVAETIRINGVLVWIPWNGQECSMIPTDLAVPLLGLKLKLNPRGGGADIHDQVPGEKVVVRLGGYGWRAFELGP